MCPVTVGKGKANLGEAGKDALRVSVRTPGCLATVIRGWGPGSVAAATLFRPWRGVLAIGLVVAGVAVLVGMLQLQHADAHQFGEADSKKTTSELGFSELGPEDQN
jgi:hypothetical protein